MLQLSRKDKMIAVIITFQSCKIFPKPYVSLKLDFVDRFKCACSNTPTRTKPLHFLLMRCYFWSKHLLIKEQYDSFIDISARSLSHNICVGWTKTPRAETSPLSWSVLTGNLRFTLLRFVPCYFPEEHQIDLLKVVHFISVILDLYLR